MSSASPANPVMTVTTPLAADLVPGVGRSLWMWCPGCHEVHRVVVASEDGTEPADGPVWGWDGDLDTPTITPSILVYDSPRRGENCHSYVRAGRWDFLTDSGHELAGQTVDMVPLPDWLVREARP